MSVVVKSLEVTCLWIKVVFFGALNFAFEHFTIVLLRFHFNLNTSSCTLLVSIQTRKTTLYQQCKYAVCSSNDHGSALQAHREREDLWLVPYPVIVVQYCMAFAGWYQRKADMALFGTSCANVLSVSKTRLQLSTGSFSFSKFANLQGKVKRMKSSNKTSDWFWSSQIWFPNNAKCSYI